MLLNTFNYHSPKTLEEATKLFCSLKSAKIQAGGTFAINSLKSLKKRGLKTAENLISLRKVNELKGVFLEKDFLKINAMTTLTEIIDCKDLQKGLFSILQKGSESIGTTPIRNMATIGGNLTCRYTWTELPAIMIALDANLHFSLPNKKEETIVAEDFFAQGAKSNHILSHVSLKNEKAIAVYQRAQKTIATDIPLLAVCIKAQVKGKQLSNVRVAINLGTNFPKRDLALESFLNKSKLSDALPEQALNNIDTSLYDNHNDEYKEHMFRICIKNAITEIITKAKK